ncbi:hypothetical protein TIFTF001_028490 [Ficus carica]|uniref:Uncharacterized protein n=1 Tax=Ficus carica TaxID=3494 RepID=A0AA88DR72_FICCA|nr:hypothetical protein TIFTF001_028490 [Ficus carica]
MRWRGLAFLALLHARDVDIKGVVSLDVVLLSIIVLPMEAALISMSATAAMVSDWLICTLNYVNMGKVGEERFRILSSDAK